MGGLVLAVGEGEFWVIFFTNFSGFILSVLSFPKPKVTAAILPMPTRKAIKAIAMK